MTANRIAEVECIDKYKVSIQVTVSTVACFFLTSNLEKLMFNLKYFSPRFQLQ